MLSRMEHGGVKAATANREKAFVSALLTVALNDDLIDFHPLTRMKDFDEGGPREVELTTGQADALVRSLPFPVNGIIEFMLASGLRKKNVLNLRVEQIVFYDIKPKGREQTLTVGQVNNVILKGGKRENLPLMPRACRVLKRHIANRVDGYVFLNPRSGKPYVSIHNTVDPRIRKLGLTAVDGSKFRIHDTRHFRANEWLNAGASLEDMKVGLGHSNISVTESYAKPNVMAVGERLSLLEESWGSDESYDTKNP